MKMSLGMEINHLYIHVLLGPHLTSYKFYYKLLYIYLVFMYIIVVQTKQIFCKV